MTDRLDEIRQRAEAATPGPWEFDSHVHGEKGCRCFSHFVVTGYTLTNPFPCCDETAEAKGASNDCTSTVVTFDDATFITHAREDIPYLLAEVERLRAALDAEKEANVTGWRMVEAKTAGIEQLTADLAAANEECDRLMDLYFARRREYNKAVAEVERLRAALEEES